VLIADRLSIGTLLRRFRGAIGVTWLLTLCETTIAALAPLFIGFAIDGLLASDLAALVNLGVLLAALILIGVARRIFDTRAYGTIRVEIGRALTAKAGATSISAMNARLGMGRELADFLEVQVPELLSAFVRLHVALVILWSFHPVLFASAFGAGILMLLIYAAQHRRFYRLNGDLNHQMERQVDALSTLSPGKIFVHLARLRRTEVRISDTEALVYGAMFTILAGFILFNLWFAAGTAELTAGRIFSIVSYSWEFVEAAIVLPATLQGWSRLAEIADRINAPD